MLHSRVLHYLDEVVRSGSIRKAAAKLNIASTAINRHIIMLEQELGQPIFERMPRRLRLTASGEILIEHVRETLKNFQRTRQNLDALKGMQQGEVSISTTLSLAEGPMARIVHDHIALHPRVQVRVRGLFGPGVQNSIISGEVGLGLGFDMQPKPGLTTLLQYDVPFGIVCAETHPLAEHKRLRLADLAPYPMVLAERDMTMRGSIDVMLSRLPSPPHVVLETNSALMMKQMAQMGKVITFLNPIDARDGLCTEGLRYIPLMEAKVQSLELVSRARNVLDSNTSRFVEHLDCAFTKLMTASAA